MPARTPLLSDRRLRIEADLAAVTHETNELRAFCLDIHPAYGKRIIETMMEMENKVFLNVSSFEEKLGSVNQTVRTLVAQSANDCLALAQEAIGNKMSGLDSRMIGLNKKTR